MPVSVNMSRVDLHDPKIVDYLLLITKKNGISPDQFLIEITESAYVEETDTIIKNITRDRKAMQSIFRLLHSATV